MKKANINEAVFEQVANGATWGEATFWETLLSQEGLEPYERRTVSCSTKRDKFVRPKRVDYLRDDD